MDDPPRVSVRDRHLVEWVARAAPGDRIPEPWCFARRPTRSVVLTLTELGVMAHPAPGTEWADVVRDARAAAQEWLDRRPADPSAA